MRSACVLLALAAVLSATLPASAQPSARGPKKAQAAQSEPTETGDQAEARALFQAGAAALKDGRYENALEHFQRSYELSKRPELLYNIGVAHDRLRHDAAALEAFEAYRAARPDADNRADVEARIDVLKREGSRATAPASVPTPSETARAAVADEPHEPAAMAQTQRDRGDRPLYKRWWLWTAVGTALVAGVVVVAIAQKPESDPMARDGTGGVLISTLREVSP